MQFSFYDTQGFYDEMFEDGGRPRPHAQLLLETVESLSDGHLLRYKHAAERLLLQMGITFNVYGDAAGTERIFPFDLIPRIVPAAEWDHIERGLRQRVHALNAFIDDIYHDRKILKDGVIPSEVVLSAASFRKQCQGLNPPCGVWCHITGTDLVRDRDGVYYVLEDNLRVPSGVSYVLENREVLKRIFPAVFEGLSVRPVSEYPGRLLEMLESIVPRNMAPVPGDPGWSCLHRAFTIPPISNTASWRSRWVCNWWKAATLWWIAAAFSCGPPPVWNASMRFTGASTTISSIPKPFAPTRSWEFPV